MKKNIFRKEVLEINNKNKYSPIYSIESIPLKGFIYFFTLLIVIFLVFLQLGTYTRKIPTQGLVTVDKGVVRVQAQQTGILSNLIIKEGDFVNKGDLLFKINLNKHNVNSIVQEDIIDKINKKKSSLNDSNTRESKILDSQILELENKLLQINAQIIQNLERQKLAKSKQQILEQQHARQQQLIIEGFNAPSSLDEKTLAVVESKNNIAMLKNEEIELNKQLKEISVQRTKLPLLSQNNKANLEREVTSLEVNSFEQQISKEIYMVAPSSGFISTINAKNGQLISTDSFILDIVPSDTKYQVELYSSSKGIGFIEKNQEVNLRFEAYPYQKFGVKKGLVKTVSRTTTNTKQIPFHISDNQNYYRIIIDLDTSYIESKNKKYPLQIGMKVDADIKTDTRTIWEWLMEPLYGLKGKL